MARLHYGARPYQKHYKVHHPQSHLENQVPGFQHTNPPFTLPLCKHEHVEIIRVSHSQIKGSIQPGLCFMTYSASDRFPCLQQKGPHTSALLDAWPSVDNSWSAAPAIANLAGWPQMEPHLTHVRTHVVRTVRQIPWRDTAGPVANAFGILATLPNYLSESSVNCCTVP